MLEVLYRIYQKLTAEEREQLLSSPSAYMLIDLDKKELLMDCFICESRDIFKQHIRDIYGNDIQFKNSSKIKPGDLFCIIIGEHCFNTEKYFNKLEYTCDQCDCKVITWINKIIQIDPFIIKTKLGNQFDKYQNKKFCCEKCKSSYIEKEIRNLNNTLDFNDCWISKDDFTRDISGYIYKISKKSTGEFYIGQTVYAPIFRWGQHLKTDRFSIENILDYQFEVIEVVSKDQNILEREKYWIQKYYRECPEKSLNISQVNSKAFKEAIELEKSSKLLFKEEKENET